MSFDINITQEAQQTKVRIEGQAALGQLMSLLNVLQVDSKAWPHEAVLFDLHSLRTPIGPADQARLSDEAARCLPRMRRIEFRWP